MEIFRSTRRIVISAMLIMGFALTTVAVYAQPDWSVNSKDYDFSTTVNAVVIVDGEEMKRGTLGAFINGECRGVTSVADDDNPTGRYIFSFKVYSNVKRGETIYFMFYGGDDDDDDDDDKGVELYAIEETGTFVNKGTIGYLWYPIRLYTYLDTETPGVISCPADITADNDAGNCGAMVDYTEPVFQDNALGTGISGEMTAGLPSGSEFPVGTTTVTYEYTDESGNGPAICSFDITVNDVEAPVPDAGSLADITAECEVTRLTAPTATDNCGGSVTATHNASLPITDHGTTVVTWTYDDGNGNTVTQNQNVVIEDTENPAITAPVDLTVEADTGSCEATGVVLGTPVTSDNCSVAGFSNDASEPFAPGQTTVTWTVTDGAGNTTTATQTVTVIDTQPPTITAPADVTVNNDPGLCETSAVNVTLGMPVAADNCGVASVTNDAPASFPVGDTYVTWTVRDNAGHTVTATQLVSVTDNEPPTITAPADVKVNTDPGLCETDAGNVTLGGPVTADNCGVFSATNNAPAVFPLGNTTVTWTVTDNHGLSSQTTQVVTVVDNIEPMVTDCPDNIVVDNDAGECGAVVTYDAPEFTYDCSGRGRAGILTEGLASGATFPAGTTTVTYAYTDKAGSIPVTCTFTVTVNDNEAPVVSTCPADIEVNNDADLQGAVITYDLPTFEDNCDGTGLTGILTDGLASGRAFPVGTTNVTYEYTDAAGNGPAICTFTVTVNYINHAPTVANPLPDLYVDEGFAITDIPITDVFTDTYIWDSFTYTASSSATGVATVQVIDNTTLRITEAGIGQANITVTATDDGLPPLSVNDVFLLNVNGRPTEAAGISDVYLDEGFVTHTIDLTGAFSDPEGDDLTYTVSSSDTDVVTVEIVNLSVVVTEVGLGTSTIMLTITDESGLGTSSDFMFTVRNVNDAPVVVNTISDQELVDNIGVLVIDLDTVFYDKDLDALNYMVILSNPYIVSYILTGTELTLSALEVGSVELTIIAKDTAFSTEVTFNVTVVEEVLLILKYGGQRMQNQDTVVVCNDAGSEQVVVVSSVKWDLRKVGAIAWLVADVDQDSMINIAFSQNFTGADRVGVIEVYDVQGHSFTFTVMQKESCYPTGSETGFMQGLQMYPNPVEQVLYITHEDELLNDVRLEIINAIGKQLYQQEIPSSTGRTIEVDMHGYDEGLYFIRIRAEDQIFVAKIIKL